TTGHQPGIEELAQPYNNIRIVEFYPGSQVCKRASLVISHGGSGTVYQALINEVPQLILPTHQDQQLNGDFLVANGLGAMLLPFRDLRHRGIEKIREEVTKILKGPTPYFENTETFTLSTVHWSEVQIADGDVVLDFDNTLINEYSVRAWALLRLCNKWRSAKTLGEKFGCIWFLLCVVKKYIFYRLRGNLESAFEIYAGADQSEIKQLASQLTLNDKTIRILKEIRRQKAGESLSIVIISRNHNGLIQAFLEREDVASVLYEVGIAKIIVASNNLLEDDSGRLNGKVRVSILGDSTKTSVIPRHVIYVVDKEDLSRFGPTHNCIFVETPTENISYVVKRAIDRERCIWSLQNGEDINQKADILGEVPEINSKSLAPQGLTASVLESIKRLYHCVFSVTVASRLKQNITSLSFFKPIRKVEATVTITRSMRDLPRTNEPRVAIVIPNYRGYTGQNDTQRCLDSLHKLTYKNWELVLVDIQGEGESPFQSADSLHGALPEAVAVTLMKVSTNIGVTGTRNLALRDILNRKEGEKADYVLSIDNDAMIVNPQILEELVEIAQQPASNFDPSASAIFAVGPTIVYHNKDGELTGEVQTVGNEFGWRTIPRFISRRFYKPNPAQLKVRQVGWLTGACMLISIPALQAIGVFDDRYFYGAEEIELALRGYLNTEKYICVHVPQVSISHFSQGINETNFGISPNKSYFGIRNYIFMLKSHWWSWWVRLWALRFVLVLARLTLINIRRRDWRGLYTLYLGVIDGLLGRGTRVVIHQVSETEKSNLSAQLGVAEEDKILLGAKPTNFFSFTNELLAKIQSHAQNFIHNISVPIRNSFSSPILARLRPILAALLIIIRAIVGTDVQTSEERVIDDQVCEGFVTASDNCGILAGKTILRFAHVSDENIGGVQRYLRDLNRRLLERHRGLTIILMYLTDDDKIHPTEERVGQGTLIRVPILIRKQGGELAIEKQEADLRLRLFIKCKKIMEKFGLKDWIAEQLTVMPLVPILIHIPVINIIYNKTKSNAQAVRDKASEILRQYNVDLIITHSIWLHHENMALAEVAKEVGIPYIVQNHVNNDLLRRFSIKQVLLRADGIAGLTTVGVPKDISDKFMPLYDGIDEEFFNLSKASPQRVREILGTENIPIILLPGRVNIAKGHQDLAKIAQRIRKKKGKDFKFRVICVGPVENVTYTEEILKFARMYGLDIYFPGGVSTEEMRNYYAATAASGGVVVLPTKSEGLGRVLLEAQAMENPVVAYNVGGVSAAMISTDKNRTGYLIRASDIDGFADAIIELLENPGKRKEMGERGRVFVVEHFSLDVLTKRHEDYYIDVINRSRTIEANSNVGRGSSSPASAQLPTSAPDEAAPHISRPTQDAQELIEARARLRILLKEPYEGYERQAQELYHLFQTIGKHGYTEEDILLLNDWLERFSRYWPINLVSDEAIGSYIYQLMGDDWERLPFELRVDIPQFIRFFIEKGFYSAGQEEYSTHDIQVAAVLFWGPEKASQLPMGLQQGLTAMVEEIQFANGMQNEIMREISLINFDWQQARVDLQIHILQVCKRFLQTFPLRGENYPTQQSALELLVRLKTADKSLAAEIDGLIDGLWKQWAQEAIEYLEIGAVDGDTVDFALLVNSINPQFSDVVFRRGWERFVRGFAYNLAKAKGIDADALFNRETAMQILQASIGESYTPLSQDKRRYLLAKARNALWSEIPDIIEEAMAYLREHYDVAFYEQLVWILAYRTCYVARIEVPDTVLSGRKELLQHYLSSFANMGLVALAGSRCIVAGNVLSNLDDPELDWNSLNATLDLLSQPIGGNFLSLPIRDLDKRLERGFLRLSPPQRYLMASIIAQGGEEVLDSFTNLPEAAKENIRKLIALNKGKLSYSSVFVAISETLSEEEIAAYVGGEIKGAPAVLFVPAPERHIFFGEDRGGGYRQGQRPSPPLGIDRTASLLKLMGLRTIVCDVNIEGINGLVELLKANRFDVISINTNIVLSEADISLINIIKEHSATAALIAGGSAAAFHYPVLLKDTPILAVIRGFGSIPLAELAIGLSRRESLEDIKGLVLADSAGVMRFNPKQQPYDIGYLRLTSIANRPEYVPYRERYWPLIDRATSRIHPHIIDRDPLLNLRSGRLHTEYFCPGECIYCAYTRWTMEQMFEGSQPAYFLSPELMVRQIEDFVAKYPQPDGIEFIWFLDGDLAVSPSRLECFCELMIEHFNGNPPLWGGFIRPEACSESLLKKMHTAGCRQLFIGGENFSERVWTSLRRRSVRTEASPKEVINSATHNAMSAGIQIIASFILFPPEAQLSDALVTIEETTNLIGKGVYPLIFTTLEPRGGAEITARALSGEYKLEYIEIPLDRGRRIKTPIRILPNSPKMQELVKMISEEKASLETELKREYCWNDAYDLPQSVEVSLLFKAVLSLISQRPEDFYNPEEVWPEDAPCQPTNLREFVSYLGLLRTKVDEAIASALDFTEGKVRTISNIEDMVEDIDKRFIGGDSDITSIFVVTEHISTSEHIDTLLRTFKITLPIRVINTDVLASELSNIEPSGRVVVVTDDVVNIRRVLIDGDLYKKVIPYVLSKVPEINLESPAPPAATPLTPTSAVSWINLGVALLVGVIWLMLPGNLNLPNLVIAGFIYFIS
ncbi:MAG: glycosyltransferase, partial [Candidatus Omnitrophica bacterium]|nr:glycosyltransferase [Candidatus Omnitrophota bacterium]